MHQSTSFGLAQACTQLLTYRVQTGVGKLDDTEVIHDDGCMWQQIIASQLIGLPHNHANTGNSCTKRWLQAIWTIMMHNRACKRSEDRWYSNVWAVAALAGGHFLALASYLQERDVELERHHQLYEVHPNLNQKPDAIIESLTIAEEPPPEGGEAFWAQIDEI